MCGPEKFPRFHLTAKATRRCNEGEPHSIEEFGQFYEHAHDLYRAAKAFFEKHGTAEVEMTIRISPESSPAGNVGEQP